MNQHDYLHGRQALIKAYKGFACSVPDAPEEVLEKIIVRQILLRAGFDYVLDAVDALGIDRVQAYWDALLTSPDPDTQRVVGRIKPYTERILKHIRIGYERAAAARRA